MEKHSENLHQFYLRRPERTSQGSGDAILQFGHHPIAMEHFGAHPIEPKSAALDEVAKCDIFVGIYAHRYGCIPNNESRSVTEQEFDFARERRIPCFCYRLNKDFPWDVTFKETGTKADGLEKFLAKIDTHLLRAEFTTPEDLAGKVVADLGREQAKHVTSRVQVLLEGEFKEFTREKQGAFVDMLAGVLHIEPNQVRLLKISSGSIIIEIELPRDAAHRLRELYEAGHPVIKELSIINVTPITPQLRASALRDQSQKADSTITTIRFRAFSDTPKRLMDIISSLVGLICLLPFFLIVVFLLKREDEGPILYRGTRVGKDGKAFKMLKFRTMRASPQSDNGPRVTVKNDPRITPLGRWLRDTKLNELPQLWNVLIGEMSLVGPRPEDPEIVKTWNENVRREILSVRPGITSPASVLYRDEESLLPSGSVMETYLKSILPSKLRLDQLYVRHRSFLLDLDLMFWTAIVLIRKWRTFVPPEELMIFDPMRRLARRYVNWFIVDTVVMLGAIALAGVIERSHSPLDLGLLKASVIAFGFTILYAVSSTLLGVYRIAWSEASINESWNLLAAVGLACASALLINQFIGDEFDTPPSMILVASAFAVSGFMILRYRGRIFEALAARLMSERVLIVGSGYAGRFMSWLLSQGLSNGAFHIVGFADDDFFKQGGRIGGVSVLGRRNDIPHLVKKHDIGMIVFAVHDGTEQERANLIEVCAKTKARVVVAPDMPGALSAN